MNASFLRQSSSRVTRGLVRRWSERLPEQDAGWPALCAELDLWGDRRARFWWRDDDAVTQTPALQRLLSVREEHQLPLAVAVIPARADGSLVRVLRDLSDVFVLAHGWNHADHGVPGGPSGELTSGRDVAQVVHELSAGHSKLAAMFPERFMPVMVPPHNHLAQRLVESVTDAKFSFVSIDGDFAGFAIPSRNVHVDVIDWQRNHAATLAQVVRSAIAALRLRRYGLVKVDTPIGLMTHHLVHDDEIWSLTTSFLSFLKQHPNVRFPEMNEIFS